MFRLIALALVLISFSAQSVEYVYVTDKLYLGLHKKASSKSKRIKVMKSGVKLEVLERGSKYIKVKTVSGAIGWSKKHLLLDKPTADRRLGKIEKQLQTTQEEKEEINNKYLKLSQITDVKQSEYSKLEEKLILSETEKVSLMQDMDALKNKRLENEIPENSIVLIKDMKFAGIALILIGILGLVFFYLGRKSYERKIREEFNGYKIW